jgi:hypothetical protein
MQNVMSAPAKSRRTRSLYQAAKNGHQARFAQGDESFRG